MTDKALPAHPSNFQFLETCSLELADLGKKAERYQHDDPATSILKVRQFAEWLTKTSLTELGVASPPKATQSEQILLLQTCAPRDVIEILHEIRRMGNRAAHELVGGRQSADRAIRLAWRLGVWYRSSVAGDSTFALPTFLPPTAAAQADVPNSPEQVEVEALKTAIAYATPRLQHGVCVLTEILEVWNQPR